MARTPRIIEDRREQIIDAALRVFARKGFTRATNKDIAAEAQITPGLIYYYFKSKEDLFQAIVENKSPLRLIKALPQETLTQPPELFLRLILGQVLAIIEGDEMPGLIRALLPEVLHNPDLAPMVTTYTQRVLNVLASYLAEQTARGALSSTRPELDAQMIGSTVMGFILRRNVLRDPALRNYSQEQLIETIVTNMLRGLLPR